MSRVCTICTLPLKERRQVDEELVVRVPYRTIAHHFGVSRYALMRHAKEHLPDTLTKAYEAEEAARADDLLRDARNLRAYSIAVLLAAEKVEDHITMLRAMRETRENLRLLGELHGKLETQPVVNIHLHPQVVELKALIMGALDSYPEASMAVLKAINGGPTNGHR